MRFNEMFHKRVPTQIKLGYHYIVWWNYKYKMACKFIQPTKCGYNFLNLETNKCILKHHLYPSKWERHQSGDWVWVSPRLNIEKTT